MSGSSLRSLTSVTLILFEESVELFVSRTIPTGNIVHLFATDSSVATTDTNATQTWKLSKVYKKATTIPDTIYVRVTCSTGATPVPPFFTVSYTYEVTVIDARLVLPTRELVLLTDAYSPGTPRTIEYIYDLPKNVGVVSLAPSAPGDPNPVSELLDAETGEVVVTPAYGAPTVSVIPASTPGNYRLRVLQNFDQPGVNTIVFTLLFGRFNAFRNYSLNYNVIRSNAQLAINGCAAVPFLIDLMSYDHFNDYRMTARYVDPTTFGSSVIINNPERFASILGSNVTPLPALEYYGTTVSDLIDELIGALDNFPLLKLRRKNDMLSFYLDNRSTTAQYEFVIGRLITFDNGTYIRTDPRITDVFGFGTGSLSSTVDPITSFHTITASEIFTRVVPPIISLELEVSANQQEGSIRQAESVRLFTFYMVGESSHRKFESTKMYPERALEAASANRMGFLRFHFVYNRLQEVTDQVARNVGIPVQFVEPYYITIRITSKSRDGKNVESYITLTGTESSPSVTLDAPLNNIVLVEVMEARIPNQAEPPATIDTRRAIMGYVVDTSLPAV